MIDWLKEAMRALPSRYANLLLYCTLTGMSGTECIEAVRPLNGEKFEIEQNANYYNPERQILQHYLYPNIFIKHTKAIYISVVNDSVFRTAHNMNKAPTQIGLKRATMRRKLNMHIKYCRKIHASWL